MRRRPDCVLVVVAALAALTLPPAPVSGAPGSAAGTWVRPVAGRVVRAFHAPPTRYGSGHLGVDFAARPGTPVRAAGAGTVVFAGAVANTRHVVVLHAGGLRTSYSFLASIRVRRGETVGPGAVLGTTGGRGEHHDGGVLHLGLRVGATFVDPMRLFGPVVAPPLRVHLAPIGGEVPSAPASTSGWSDERRALLAGLAGPPAPVVAPASRTAPAPAAESAAVCAHRIAPWCAWLARNRVGPG